MLCENCGKEVATVHLTEIEKGKLKERNFCEACAQKKGVVAKAPSLHEILGGMIQQQIKALGEEGMAKCPFCGIRFGEFRAKGRLGCPHDYVQFEHELEPLIANIHGAVEHTGRRPQRPAGSELPESTESLTQVIGLRKGIREAVEQEEYERAGSLRDEINQVLDNWHAEQQAADGTDAAQPSESPS